MSRALMLNVVGGHGFLAVLKARHKEIGKCTNSATSGVPQTGSRVGRALKQLSEHSNVEEKQLDVSPHADEVDSPDHLARMGQNLASAKASLHRDVCAASSPASSIGSRLTMDATGVAGSLFLPTKHHIFENTVGTDQSWRYSFIPRYLATPRLDVREPLPSPILPGSHNDIGADGERPAVHEPLSSGYSSPILPNSRPTSDIHLLRRSVRDDPEVHGAEEANFDHDSNIDYFQYPSGGSFVGITPSETIAGSIYMSESALAAGENAKAKRQLFANKTMTYTRHNISSAMFENYPDLATSDSQIMHHADAPVDSMFALPDAEQRIQQKTSSASLVSKNTSRAGMETARHRHLYEHQQLPRRVPGVLASRATATGSPLPVSGAEESTGYYHLTQMQPTHTTPSERRGVDIPTSEEHFQPGWYYTRNRLPQQSPLPIYSFSTAASKVIGSDQAPDSRMRDSYKTDTLTALPRPTNRYRKNGIGAAVPARGVSRYYMRQIRSQYPPSADRPFYAGRQYSVRPSVQFTSSPPRGSAYAMYAQVTRKRALHSPTVFTEPCSEQGSIEGLAPALMPYHSDEVISVDEDTKTAVRMSILGNAAWVTMDNETGLRELSPNVVATRKSISRAGLARKKRRPSYWDSDLEEIRESPAVRRGVNSPFSAQQSMKADVETVSMDTVEVRPEAYHIGQAKSMESVHGQKIAHASPYDLQASQHFRTDSQIGCEVMDLDGQGDTDER